MAYIDIPAARSALAEHDDYMKAQIIWEGTAGTSPATKLRLVVSPNHSDLSPKLEASHHADAMGADVWLLATDLLLGEVVVKALVQKIANDWRSRQR